MLHFPSIKFGISFMTEVLFHSFGKALGSRCVTNDDLCAYMQTSDEWIQQRSGIKTRYWVGEGQTTSSLGAEAARESLRLARLEGNTAVDCVIAATLSPDHTFPGIGVQIQQALGLAAVPAYDIRNQCSGFLYGLEMAVALVRAGQYQRVLLVGAEVHSTGLDLSTRGRDVAVLFGDGAGACIVEAAASQAARGCATQQPMLRVIGTELHSDGAHMRELWCEHPGSANAAGRVTTTMIEAGTIFPKMNGRAVFEQAVRRMVEVSQSLLTRCQRSVSEVSLLVPHQANSRINAAVAQHLGIGPERVMSTIEKYGNTTAATIPIGFYDALQSQRVQPGGLVLSAAFGSGFTWGAGLFEGVGAVACGRSG
jgi:3-oxoacyl-[acyl-carrier-protein] synthase-3